MLADAHSHSAPQDLAQRRDMFVCLCEQLEDLGVLRVFGVGGNIEVVDGGQYLEAGTRFLQDQYPGGNVPQAAAS